MEYRCGVHVAIADAKLRARFPWIDEEIRMKLSANCADARMRSTPLSEEELARFDVNMANIPRDARVFPAFIEGTEEIDSDEYRAIPDHARFHYVDCALGRVRLMIIVYYF
jgi:hypothetical protein